MATLQLSRSAQSQLGRKSATIDIKAWGLRRKALMRRRKEQKWLLDDSLPVPPIDRATIDQLKPGTAVIERIAPCRLGVVCRFGFLVRYGKCPIIRWEDGRSGESFALPQWLSIQQQQLSLF